MVRYHHCCSGAQAFDKKLTSFGKEFVVDIWPAVWYNKSPVARQGAANAKQRFATHSTLKTEQHCAILVRNSALVNFF